LFASNKGFDVAAVAAFMSALLLGGALAQFPLGMLADRVDRRKILLIGAAGAVVAALALATPLRPGLTWALGGSFALGACELPLYALCVALANDAAAPHERIEISSGVVFAYAAGAVTGPPIAAALMESGSFALPLFVAGAYALFVIVLLLAIRKTPHAGRSAAAVILSDLSP
jgi:MFS family permease